MAKRIPILSDWYRAARERRHLAKLDELAVAEPAAVFDYIYEQNVWNSRESASGAGSERARTAALRAAFPGLLRETNTRTLLDLPCGDLNWIQLVDLTGISYIGADIVDDLIRRNTARYGSAAGGQMEFTVANLIEDDLPVADTILSRDCLVHLRNDQVVSALANIQASPHLRWMLLTHFPTVEENREITTGDWRPTNLCLPPFNLPEPDLLLDEEFVGRDGHPQYLGAWRLRSAN